jgi:hypothetical protein
VDPAHGSDDGVAGTVSVGAGKTPRAPSDLKPVAKRATAATVAGGSSGGAAVTASAGVGKALRAPPPLGLEVSSPDGHRGDKLRWLQ